MNENSHAQTSASAVPAQQQFGLIAIFYLLAVYAAGLPFGAWTIVLTALILGGWLSLFRLKYGRRLIALTLLLVFLLGLFIPSLQQVRSTHYRGAWSLNQLRWVVLAMINYESENRAFPPGYKTDDTGKPIHSWRVLILPFIEQKALYEMYDLNEPWDGPNNIKLLDEMPPIYSRCERDPPANLTPYKLVVDQGTPFEGGKTLSYADIRDGTSNTIAIVEDFDNPVPWTKPEDLTIEQAIALLGGRESGNVIDVWNNEFTKTLYGPSVSFLDGSTHRISPWVDHDVIRNFCTCDDGQAVDREMLGDRVTVVKWDRCVALIAYIILLIVPGLVALKRTIASRYRGR